MKNLILPTLATILLMTSQTADAQPGSGGPTPDPAQPTAIPIDGGASLVLAGGVAYGLKRLRRWRRP